VTDSITAKPASNPDIRRVRHELKRRELTVRAVEYTTPQMLRLTLTGDDLADFPSAAPDDHIKVFLNTDSDQREMRDYTPRKFYPDTNSLDIEFAVHDAGPATKWAINAQVGDTLLIGGPRGSVVISGVGRWVLVGDETALPAIARRIEEAREDTSIISVVAVTGTEAEQDFDTAAKLESHWVHRALSQATDASGIIFALDAIPLEPDTFVWVAAEASVARAVRTYLTEIRGHPLNWLKASGYWAHGKADTHEDF